MKKMSFALLAMIIAAGMVFTGCRSDSDDPTIRMTFNGNRQANNTEIRANYGSNAALVFYFTAPRGIAEIELNIDGLRNQPEIIRSNFDSRTSHRVARTLPLDDTGNFQIKATVVDVDGNSSDFSLRVSVRD